MAEDGSLLLHHRFKYIFDCRPQAIYQTDCQPTAGAEFEVLGAMVEDGSLLLADALDVKWNDIFRPDQLEWPAFYSQVFFLSPYSHARSMTPPRTLQLFIA